MLRDHTTLVLGPVSDEVAELARATASERHSDLVSVRDLGPATELASPAPFLRRNFAVALARGDVIGELDIDRVREVAAATELPGRAQELAGDPPVILDAAQPRRGTGPGRGAARAGGGSPGDGLGPCSPTRTPKASSGRSRPRSGMVATELPAPRLASAGRPGATAMATGELAAFARAAGIQSVAEEPEPSPRSPSVVRSRKRRAACWWSAARTTCWATAHREIRPWRWSQAPNFEPTAACAAITD